MFDPKETYAYVNIGGPRLALSQGARTVDNVFQGLSPFLRPNNIFIAGALLGKLDFYETIGDTYTKDELKTLKRLAPEAP